VLCKRCVCAFGSSSRLKVAGPPSEELCGLRGYQPNLLECNCVEPCFIWFQQMIWIESLPPLLRLDTAANGFAQLVIPKLTLEPFSIQAR
jgi:hypothetical protein